MATKPKPKAGERQPTRTPGITKRMTASGEWRYDLRVYDPATRKRVNKSFASEREAKDFKRDFEDQKADVRRDGAGAETVESWSRRWLIVAPRGKESTNIHNTERLKWFVRDFGDRKLEGGVSPAEARLWTHGGPAGPALEKVAADWSGSERDERGTVLVKSHSSQQTVKAFYNDAIRHIDEVTSNPFAGVGKSNGSRQDQVRQQSWLTHEEVDELARLAARIHGPAMGVHVVGPMIVVAGFTGLRPGELFALYPEDVDLEAEELHVRRAWNSKTKKLDTPKSHLRRTVALLDEATEAFRGLQLELCEPGAPIFRSQRQSAMTQRNLHYYWNPIRTAFAASKPADHWLNERIRRQGKKGDLDFYELRHHFGSYLASLGATPYDIAEQMGHSDGGAIAMRTYIKTHSVDSRARVKALQKAAKAA